MVVAGPIICGETTLVGAGRVMRWLDTGSPASSSAMMEVSTIVVSKLDVDVSEN